MILTVTLNPSVDISYSLEKFTLDAVNRVSHVSKTAGGKGLNVSRVLHQLGDDVLATGFLGGSLGDFIRHQLEELGISHSFFPISGETRNCIAVLHERQQTELLEAGPTVSKSEGQEFLNYFENLLTDVNAVVISGSLPRGLATDYYRQMVAYCRQYGLPVIVDCSGSALKELLLSDCKPTVIKPNSDELSDLLGKSIEQNISSLKSALSQELFEGIDWIVVSLGAEGCFAKHGDKYYRVTIPEIQVANPVGSGDSTVAGIASALLAGVSDDILLKKANTLGMLNAQEATTGYVNLENYDKLFNHIEVVEV